PFLVSPWLFFCHSLMALSAAVLTAGSLASRRMRSKSRPASRCALRSPWSSFCFCSLTSSMVASLRDFGARSSPRLSEPSALVLSSSPVLSGGPFLPLPLATSFFLGPSSLGAALGPLESGPAPLVLPWDFGPCSPLAWPLSFSVPRFASPPGLAVPFSALEPL